MTAAPDRLTYLGRSLGGAAAAWVAKAHPPQQLLLQSTFANLADTAANGYPLAGVCRVWVCHAWVCHVFDVSRVGVSCVGGR
jgi:hypothetical protein